MTRKNGWLLAIACVAGVLGVYWWLESSTRPAEKAEQPPSLISRKSAPAGSPVSAPGELPTGELPGSPPSLSTEPAQAEASARPTVGDILAAPDEDYVRVAKKLTAITLDPRAPMDEREEALAHALNLSAGNEAEVLTPLVKDANLPDSLADTILAEALNRPLAYQADLYLAALTARKSPEMQTKIREHLAFLIGGEDKGPNPADWAEAIKTAKASWAQ